MWLVDVEILEGALCLGAPVFGGVDLYLAEGICFRSCRLQDDRLSVSEHSKRGSPASAYHSADLMTDLKRSRTAMRAT